MAESQNTINPGDRVTITREGAEFTRGPRVVHYVRAVFGILNTEGGTLLSIDGNTARVEISLEKFPFYRCFDVPSKYPGMCMVI